MTAARHPLWERRLADYVAAVVSAEHCYGELDCLLHPANAVEAVTGEDPAREHREKYRSHASAVRYLRQLGFESPEALLDSQFDEVAIGFAQRGDLALTPANQGEEWAIPGVVAGENKRGEAVALCISPSGLMAEPRSRWLKAWKVGR